jgi:hypothetical protein
MFSTSRVPKRTGTGVVLGLVLAVAPALLLAGWPAQCQAWPWCCPCYVHHSEGPPRIWWHLECGRPVCPPCDSEFYGYYPTCWRAWNVCANCNGDPPWVPQAPVPPLGAAPYPATPQQGVPQLPQPGVPPTMGTPEGGTPGLEEVPEQEGPGMEMPQPTVPDLPQPRLKPTSLSSRPRLGPPEPMPAGQPQVQNWDSILPASYVPTRPR